MEDISTKLNALHVEQPDEVQLRRPLNLSTVAEMMGLVGTDTTQQDDVVFLCIDCEAYERAQHKITEIGIATLDTRSLRRQATVLTTDLIIEKMQYAHFRPVEYSNLLNQKFVKGCPDSFSFGHSTWIKLSDAAELLTRVFQDPSTIHDAAHFSTPLSDSKRNVVLVGHGLKNDESYLRRLGFNTDDVVNIVGHADTQRLAEVNMIALTKVLAGMDIHAVNLHNAGNDAAYTLQGLVKMAAMECAQNGSVTDCLRRIKHRPVEIHTSVATVQYIWAGSSRPGDERRNRAQKPRRGTARRFGVQDSPKTGNTHSHTEA